MKIYLAGPDVFRSDAAEHGARLKDLCARHGMVGLFPLDGSAGDGLRGMPAAAAICSANLALIDSADLLMANLNAFRGHEPDSGTVFEVGYAHARGIPVWAYVERATPMIDRLRALPGAEGGHVDADGWLIEDFGLPLNLMIACTVTIVAGSADDCLRRIAASLGPPAGTASAASPIRRSP